MDDQGTSVAMAPSETPASSADPGPRAPRPWRPPIRAVVLAALALGGVAAGFYLYEHRGASKAARGGEESRGEHESSSGLPVEVAHPRRGGIERSTTQAGSVHAFEHAALYSKVSGYLKVQNVDIGDRVKLGQLLAVIDDPEVDKAVDQARAALDQALAKVHVGEARVRSARAAKEAAEALVKVSDSMVAAKSSNETLQRVQLTRVAGLVAGNAVEPKLEDEQKFRRDVAVADVGVARAEVLSAQAQVINKEAMIEEAQADLLEARANVEVAQANLARAKVMQDYTRIASPYDGVITIRSFHRGDFIRSASEGGNIPVLAVAETDRMRVVLPMPDTFVPLLDKGDKARLQMRALPGVTFSGEVSRFSYTEDPGSRSMRTEVDLPNPDGRLVEGMYGDVTVILQAAAPDGVTIPSSGLLGQTGQGDGTVFVVKDGKAHKVQVRVGNDNGLEAEILKGLSPSDEVIITYSGSVEDGTPVKAESRKAAQPSH